MAEDAPTPSYSDLIQHEAGGAKACHGDIFFEYHCKNVAKR